MTIDVENYKEKMEELLKDSIRVTPNTTQVYPQFHAEDKATFVPELIEKFPNCYSINNSTVAYVFDNGFFVTPYTNSVVNTLRANGFEYENFFVPFSNWDYPKEQQREWERLVKKAYDEKNVDSEE